jgi:Protein of unknown function (DUF4238)
MATNKNQHFVPRCYLRPFTLDSANAAINLFNIDRRIFVERAPVKHQCSGDYFYGENPALEKALQSTEGAYAAALRDILAPGFILTDDHRDVLRHFWLLQYMRTEAASRRAVEMAEEARSVIGVDGPEFNLSIRQAVILAMETFVDVMNAVDDLRVCLLRNLTPVPFVTSDNPAVLSNRWHLEDARVRWRSFGLQSAGDLLLLPLSPQVLCVGYDGDVNSIPDEGGWDEVRNPADVEALNQHQFLNCRANIFVRNATHAGMVRDSYDRVAQLRPSTRHRVHYAVRDGEERGSIRYRVIDPSVEGSRHQEAILHTETVHARPTAWPWRVRARRNGVVFSNGTAVGYVRRAWVRPDARSPFHREAAWP